MRVSETSKHIVVSWAACAQVRWQNAVFELLKSYK